MECIRHQCSGMHETLLLWNATATTVVECNSHYCCGITHYYSEIIHYCCGMLHNSSGMLHNCCRMLHNCCRMLHNSCGMLHNCCGMLHNCCGMLMCRHWSRSTFPSRPGAQWCGVSCCSDKNDGRYMVGCTIGL